MKQITTPNNDSFRMPGEFETHSGCIIIWPQRPGSWIYGAVKAREAFAEVACRIAESEDVYILTTANLFDNVRQVVSQVIDDKKLKPVHERIHVMEIDSDDAWARDVGPTFVVDNGGQVRGIDWQFNAWGGTYDGLYQNWEKDDRVASVFCEQMDYEMYDAHPFVLEGGSIHSDGEGTLIVTESCLLSRGRNPQMTKSEIEERLCEYLGASKVIWLPNGIYMDETNEHVDNVCAFVRPAEVVLAWTDDPEDPQYRMSLEDYECLCNEVDAKGRKIKVTKLPIPKKPVCITAEELAGFEFEEGEDDREEGERLAASYVNFYISNSGVVVPQFGDVNDSLAVEILAKCFPEREILPVYARDIIVGGGNIHCITQQIPKGGKK
ncbi:MAG: agmatine deiminase [Agathobacter sp.]|nr:agmatine deiminase [Agathobacter sp.]